MPILDSQGRPVSINTRSIRSTYDTRTPALSAPRGSTMLSKFSGTNGGAEYAKFKKLAADIETANPSIRSPLLNQSNFYMPESDSSTGEPNRLLNQWITYYLKWHAMCGSVIDLHSTVANTLILTDKGVKPISEATAEDWVIAKDGTWQHIQWNENHGFSGELCTIKAAGCVSEQYTYNHPVLVALGGKILKKAKDGQSYFAPDIVSDPDYIPATRVKKGDYLVFPKYTETRSFGQIDLCNYVDKYINTNNTPIYEVVNLRGTEYISNITGTTKRYTTRYLTINEELAELLGWYVAEGSSCGSTVEFSLNNEKDPCNRINNLLIKIFGVNTRNRDRGKSRNLTFASMTAANFFRQTCGCGAANKKIPDFIYLNTPSILKAFVLGYLGGDGFVFNNNVSKETRFCKGGYIQCTTISKTLAYQLRIFCTKLGFLFSIRENTTKRTNSAPKNDKPNWILMCALSMASEALYGKNVNTKTPVKIKQDSKYFYIPVKEITREQFDGRVYDIKTDDGSFTTTFTVHNSELPLSRFSLRGITDKTVLNFFETMAESMDLHLKAVDILKQYFGYGEAIPFAFWSDTYNSFTDLTLLDGNFLYVKGHYLCHSDEGDDVEFYELEPDPLLVNVVKSDDYVNKILATYLDEEFVSAVRQNKRVLLSNFSTHMIKNKLKFSDLRGTSIMLRCLKSLLYSDKLRESQYVVADGHINPKWIWKIGQAGDLSSGGYMPSEEDLEAFRDLLISSNNDPLFTIITHYAVAVDAIGLNGKLLPITAELDHIENEILTALFCNKAMTTGEGPTYATASVAFRTLMSRYIPVRAKLERYFYQKLFAPVAYANKFYERKQCDLAHSVRTGDEETNKLLIPTIDWRSKSNLLDDGSIKSIISSMVNTGRLPMKILTEALDLDYTEVRDYLYSEQATVFDPVAIDARKKISSTNTDETMLGQPYAPKTNSPVSMKTAKGEGAQPKAAKASLEKDETKKPNKFKKLLTIKSLSGKDPIQTQVDKGIPKADVLPKTKPPMEKALDIDLKANKDTAKDAVTKEPQSETGAKEKPASKDFDLQTDSKNERMLKTSLVQKKFDCHKAKKYARVVDGSKEPLKNDFMKVEPWKPTVADPVVKDKKGKTNAK